MKVRIACSGAGTAKLEDLREFQGELKSLSKANFQKLRAEIINHGFSEPILVWKDPAGALCVINGHQRLRVLRTLVEKEGADVGPLPVAYVEAESVEAAKHKVLAMASQFGTIEKQGLYEFMSEAGLKFETIRESFEFPEIDFRRFGAEFFESEIKEDEVPEPPKVAITKPGDLWELGEHRLLCGDSSDRTTYRKLLGEKAPDLLVTDPPYGVAYQDSGGNRLKGDLTQAIFPVAVSCCVEALSKNARIYVFCASDQIAMADMVFTHHLSLRPKFIVWIKEHFVLRHNGYHSKFEMVCYGWKGRGGDPEFWNGDRKQVDVWNIRRDSNPDHPTQKPIEVCAIPIRNSSKKGDIMLEPFAGSGSTLVAAEQLNRKCYAIEIEPKYCDVIVQRWEQLTGRAAKRKKA